MNTQNGGNGAHGTAGTTARRRPRTLVLVYVLLLAGLAVAALCSVMFGSRVVSFGDVVRALTPGASTSGSRAVNGSSSSTIAVSAVRLRIPRTVLGIVVGASLAVAGALMQGVSRNPLADPSLLGLNTGAAFAIVCAIAFLHLSTPSSYIWVALIGSAATAALVWAIGSMGYAGPTPLKLTLAGAVLSSVLSSLTSAVLLPRTQTMSDYRFWQVGGVSGARFNLMAPIVPLLLIGLVIALCCAQSLNTLALGDELAAGLGLRLTRTRIVVWAGAVLLCSGATALAGPIGFVGLIVPHAARMVVSSDYRRIIPMCMVMGPLLLVAADVIGRVVTRPADVEVGIVTAIIGAPIFLYLVRKRNTAGV